MGGYWEINGNYWSKLKYTRDQAEKLSETLINCTYCTDCRGCTDCTYCTDCRGCRGCRDCRDCTYCTGCTGCTGCRDCTGFKKQPQQYSTPFMGSDNRINYLHWNDDKHEVTCGCFKGTIDELEKRVADVHGGNKYGKEYKMQIKIFRMLISEVE